MASPQGRGLRGPQRASQTAAPPSSGAPSRTRRQVIAAAIVAGNAAIIIGLWLHDGGVTGVHDLAGLLTSLGRITGLLGAYLLLLQVLLLARIRPLERLVGFDRLTVWHRVNGKACLYLILAHIVLITAGYTLTDRISLLSEIRTFLTLYTGILDATIGTGLLILVVVSSLVIARRRLRYEAWYLVHLTSYVAVVLAWFHQLPTGNDFILNPRAAQYWAALYLVTLALVLLCRVTLPLVHAFRYQMRVADVSEEGPGVVSLRITGRRLDRLNARAGQFFLWRFLTPRLMWESHPFSLSAAPDGQSLRITVKSLGDFTSRMGEMKPGTRVLAVGPFGLFTTEALKSAQGGHRVALIAGGIGITPIRALVEEMSGDLVLVYRLVSAGDAVFRDELDELARERGFTVHYVVGHHLDPDAKRLLTAEHLRELIPDIARREVFVCGPPVMSQLVTANVRKAGVPAKHIHTEEFAFSPETRGRRGGASLPKRIRLGVAGLTVAALLGIAARFTWVSTHATAAPTTSTPQPTATSIPPTPRPATTAPRPTSVPPTTAPVAAQYAGSTITYHDGSIQVTVTTKSSRIADVSTSAAPNDPRSQQIESGALPILRQETLQAQSAQINAVSGATETTDAYVQSLQAAIDRARSAGALK